MYRRLLSHIHVQLCFYTCTQNLALCLLITTGRPLLKVMFYFPVPGTGSKGEPGYILQLSATKFPTLSTLKLNLHMLHSHQILLCGHTSTREQCEHNPWGFFFIIFFLEDWKMEVRRDAWKSTEDLHRQSHDTVRKPKSVLAFIQNTKETVDKSWANFAESLRLKIKK